VARLNLVLAVLLIFSGLYLVRVSYESRRLFAEIENAHGTERQLEADRRRLEAERQAQATHLRVERVAHDKLAMRAATPANTTYVTDPGLAAAPSAAPVAPAGADPGGAR
jgi:cell division protein FtsL